jgi:SAM-dependent methyltransferase
MDEFHKNLVSIGKLLLIFLLVIWLIRYYTGDKTTEGFSQAAPFVLRQNEHIYDPFYLQYYDDLYASELYSDQDMSSILQYTNPTNKSIFLDIGCGTGILLQKLEDKGYLAFGVDKSHSMVQKATERLKQSEVQCDDVLRDPLLYENNTFSHIVCTHFTIYEMKDKKVFFKHCFHWVQGGGYLVVHLVEPAQYKKVVPSTDLSTSSSAIVKTKMDFKDYHYTNEFQTKEDEYTQLETFTDAHTGHVRKNEKRLYMESKSDILLLAMECGFLIHAETTYVDKLKDEYQYLVIMVKPLCGSE